MMRKLALLGCLACLACGHPNGDDEAGARRTFIEKKFRGEGGDHAWELTLDDDVHFAEGFCLTESTRVNGHFTSARRPMGHHGVVRLTTHGARPMKLVLSGVVPKHPFFGKAVITLTLQGDLLDSFVLDHDRFEHSMVVPGELLASRKVVDLGISVSRWPDEHYGDCTTSGFAIEGLRWTFLD